MNKKKVVLTQRYQDEAIAELDRDFDLRMVEGSGKPLLRVLAENPDTEALICFLSDPVGREVMDAAPRLKIIANYAVGYNNIDVGYALEKKLWVTHTPDILTEATADLTMALVLATARHVVAADSFLRRGCFTGWGANLFLGKELKGAVMGIVGLGRIGGAVARRALGFGMRIAGFSRSRRPELENSLGMEFMPLEDLLAYADIISVHIPSAPATVGMFDKKAFDRMKKDAIFINVSRGNLMDEAALTEKLEKRELFAAGLDVYECEPRVTERLLKLDNVVLLPHIGSATFSARLGMARMTIENVRRVLWGEKPLHPVPECRDC